MTNVATWQREIRNLPIRYVDEYHKALTRLEAWDFFKEQFATTDLGKVATLLRMHMNQPGGDNGRYGES